MQAVIMAGGRGTRLRELTKDLIPKPMIEICGKPLLQWQIENLKENGIDNIIVVVGHLGDVILDKFNGTVVYYDEERLKNILQTLANISKEKQIIILTCSDREINMLKQNNINYNEINL